MALRLRPLVVCLTLLPLLSGCVAAVALPALAGSALMVRSNHRVRAATRLTKVPAAQLKTKQGHVTVGDSEVARAVVVPGLTELPPPTLSPTSPPDDPWQPFFAYAAARTLPGGETGQALKPALLAAGGSLDPTKRRECRSGAPAVIIDLDLGSTPFVPAQAKAAAAPVVQGLAQLRKAGVVVLWISQLPATRVADVARALQVSGLDPRSEDQLLLIRKPDHRKQLLREQANDDVCVVAIAGDQRSDFDELFDYLRNPAAASALDAMVGDGWFLVPPLFAQAPEAPSQPTTSVHASADAAGEANSSTTP